MGMQTHLNSLEVNGGGAGRDEAKSDVATATAPPVHGNENATMEVPMFLSVWVFSVLHFETPRIA